MSSSQTAVGAVGAVSAAVGGSSAAVPATSMTTVGNIHRISSFWGNFTPGTITRDPRVQNVFFFLFLFYVLPNHTTRKTSWGPDGRETTVLG